jgi:hypothetical protein
VLLESGPDGLFHPLEVRAASLADGLALGLLERNIEEDGLSAEGIQDVRE